MKIFWINSDKEFSSPSNSLIDKEYELRKNLMQLLIKQIPELDLEEIEKINLHFCLHSNTLELSSDTPEPLYSQLGNIIKSYKFNS